MDDGREVRKVKSKWGDDSEMRFGDSKEQIWWYYWRISRKV